jgi:carbonic anhydrase/acetyltransferase-like protein (isoleucine patch superfamily)
MSIRRINGVFLADTARVLGEVELGLDVTIWYGAAIRGDVARIVIGERSNVQDNAVIHCDSGVPNIIGSDVIIGHGAIVHGKAVGDGTLIGMGATVLGQTVIGKRCLIAAGAVVPPGLHVPDGMVVMGVPGRIVRPTNDEEKRYMAWLAPHYVELAKLHAGEPDHPRTRPWTGNPPAPATVA